MKFILILIYSIVLSISVVSSYFKRWMLAIFVSLILLVLLWLVIKSGFRVLHKSHQVGW